MNNLTILSSIGNFLGGVAILVLIFDFVFRRNRAYQTAHSERINRTFFYIERLNSFRWHFFNIFRYMEYKRGASSILDVMDINPVGQNITIHLPGSEEVVRRNLVELYLFLKEINLLLGGVKRHKLIDYPIIREAFESYKINLNNFFRSAFEEVATREIKFGKIQGIGGDFTRENLVNLIESLKKYFPFLE